MTRKKLAIISTGSIVALSVIFLTLFGNPILLKNRNDLGKSIKSIDSEQVTINDIVPFEWDKVYTFQPYTSKQTMEDIIGVSSRHITETVSEGMVQLIFVKDESVVCTVNGNAYNLGYNISFLQSDEDYAEITYEEDAKFLVEQNEEKVVRLIRIMIKGE